jgi:hypothetical protein
MLINKEKKRGEREREREREREKVIGACCLLPHLASFFFFF